MEILYDYIIISIVKIVYFKDMMVVLYTWVWVLLWACSCSVGAPIWFAGV